MRIVVHEDPVGRAEVDHLARAGLAPFGLPGQVEQLRLRALNDGTHAVACTPFRTYGIDLGDIVLLGEDDCVSEVVRSPWHRTLRLAFVADLPAGVLRRAADGTRAEVRPRGWRVSGTASASWPSTSRPMSNPPDCSR
ncbi:hypothetical protein ACIRD3_04770 [Kitasatospora sp. NPDC093550]|uniref:hypothetical protein n=1 Tax=Kitasatospora sp. NPDC093550 TaxID=3364089 RepID=UPI0038126846